MLLAVAPGSADSRFEGVARLDTAELAILAATDNDDLPLVNPFYAPDRTCSGNYGGR